jgi:hypothetical protein
MNVLMRTRAAWLIAVLVTHVGGCMFIKPIRAGLPPGARLTQESGATLTYTAAETGTIYLRDPAEDRILARLPASPGQRLDVDARANAVTFDGRAVTTAAALRGDRDYQIYFVATRAGS